MGTIINSNIDPGDGGGSDVFALEDAWPTPLGPADRALWDQLSAHAREVVLRRVRAIVAADRKERPIAELAADAGLDRTRFFRLRQLWDREPSLRTLAPQARRRPRKIASHAFSTTEGAQAAAEVVERVVHATRGAASTSFIAAKVVEALDGAMALQTATRLVRLQRAQSARDETVLRVRFGEEMLIDLSAVSLALADDMDQNGAVVVAVVVDVASQLIVGHAAGAVRHSVTLQQEAMRRALDLLDVAEPRGPRARTTVVVGWAEEKVSQAVEFFALATPGVTNVLSRKPGRFGRHLVDIVGHRIDRLRLRPKSTSPDAVGHRGIRDLTAPPMSVSHARALVDEAVDNYNAPILAILTGGGLIRPTGQAGARLASILSDLVRGFNYPAD